MGLGVNLHAGGAVAAALLELGARDELARFAEGSCRVAGRLVLELHGGAQAELHAGVAHFTHPASSLQAAAASGAVASVQLHVECALLLLPSSLPATP